jgi:hypothetical protein
VQKVEQIAFEQSVQVGCLDVQLQETERKLTLADARMQEMQADLDTAMDRVSALESAIDAAMAAKQIKGARVLLAAALGRATLVPDADPLDRPDAKPRGRPKADAEGFHAALRAAQMAAPYNWHLVPDASGWAEIPNALRSYETKTMVPCGKDKTKPFRIKIPAAIRIPAARYWRDGLPDSVKVQISAPESRNQVARRMLQRDLDHAETYVVGLTESNNLTDARMEKEMDGIRARIAEMEDAEEIESLNSMLIKMAEKHENRTELRNGTLAKYQYEMARLQDELESLNTVALAA